MQLNLPTINLFGEQAIEQLYHELEKRQWKSTLIITDEYMRASKTFQRILHVFSRAKIKFKVFDQTRPDPSIELVEQACGYIKGAPCDFILTLGGGSAHDLGKGVALLSQTDQSIKAFVGVDKIGHKVLPIVAINTTSGTGSEVTRFAIISDVEEKVKLAIIDDALIPAVSVNDTQALLSMPPSLTGATGMDALTHAIEAYFSVDANALTNAYAVKAMELIGENLISAYMDGTNVLARENMAQAQFMAGVAFSNASLGYVHAIAHQLGGRYHLPHGLCNAVLLPIVIDGLVKKDRKIRFDAIGRALKAPISSYGVIGKIKQMNKKLNIPDSLSKLGVVKEDLNLIAKKALEDPCRLTSPVQFNQDELVALLMKGL
ncbi:iron-containing alcohol dehydrogenase [Vallitaleaceae bacterium 9-2]